MNTQTVQLDEKTNRPSDPKTPTCRGCATKNPVERLFHHMGLDEREKLTAHMVEQYGAGYENDGRLKRRLDLVHEAERLFRSVDAVQNDWNLADIHYLALRNLGFIHQSKFKSGTEMSAPREK